MIEEVKKTKRKQQPFQFNDAYRKLLLGIKERPFGLAHLFILTPHQINALCHDPGTINHTTAKLKTLQTHEYVQIDSIRGYAHRPPYYVVLAKNGIREARKAGLHIPNSMRASKELHTDMRFLEHTIELNWILISAICLDNASYRLDSFVHERTLRQKPFMVTIQDRQRELIPDALVRFKVMSEREERVIPLVIEHDRATEGQKNFREKIKKYGVRLQTHPCHVVFTTFEGSKHVADMRRWTKAELEQNGDLEAISHLLYFANLSKQPKAEVWWEPRWHPLEGEPVAILKHLHNLN